MRLQSTISDARRRAIIAPEVAALYEGEYYATLLANTRSRTELDPTGQFLIPVASFLARAARHVLAEQETCMAKPVQVKDRAQAGIREVKHISRVCVEDGVFGKYAKDNAFDRLAINPNKIHTRLSVFGEAIFRDIGWIAGGVVRAMHDKDLPMSPAETLLNSAGLQRIGWVPETALGKIRLHLGMPYIKPDNIELLVCPKGKAAIASITAQAMAHIPLARDQMGCPARRVLDPGGRGTAFAAEWIDMVEYLVPAGARADGPIGAVFDS